MGAQESQGKHAFLQHIVNKKLSSHQNAYIILNMNNTVSLETELQYSVSQRISTVPLIFFCILKVRKAETISCA